MQSQPVADASVSPADQEPPALLHFQQVKETDFDPLGTSGQTSAGGDGLLSELASLEEPTQSSMSLLLPTQTTPLTSTQADLSSAFGLTTNLAPPTSTSVANSMGLSSISTSTGGMGMGLHTTGSMGMSTGGMSADVSSGGLQVLSKDFS